MRVGGTSSPYSAHQAGMSSLWHDVDYIPEKRFETPLVNKGLQDMALPSEQHQLPDGVADPFAKMEEVFDVAAAQMEAGRVGQAFLHGTKRVVEAVRADLDQVRLTNQAAATPITTSKNATKTAAEKEAVSAAPNASSVGDALGAIATFMPMAASQAVQSVVQGPMPALASQAVTVAGSVASAGELAAIGVAEALKEDAPVAPKPSSGGDEPVVVRRGLRK